jgi:uncharacterized membrane protein
MSDEERNANPADMPPLPPADAPAGRPVEEPMYTETPGVAPATEGAQAFDAAPDDVRAQDEPVGGQPFTTPPPSGGASPQGYGAPRPAGGANVPPGYRPAFTRAPASDDDRLMSALAWFSMAVLQIPLVSVVLLLSEETKGRPFQRYHAITSILFWIAGIIYEVLAGIAFLLLSIVSFGLLALCLWVIFFVPHVIAIWYAVQAYQGRYPEIPFISQLARDQHWV